MCVFPRQWCYLWRNLWELGTGSTKLYATEECTLYNCTCRFTLTPTQSSQTVEAWIFHDITLFILRHKSHHGSTPIAALLHHREIWPVQKKRVLSIPVTDQKTNQESIPTILFFWSALSVTFSSFIDCFKFVLLLIQQAHFFFSFG